ncbi:MAG: winged helix-turn-helix domain-containing protein [Lachnospiraceae bacterium]|nr:winged helix-turn-helix domain-containing protein [Lachnospiraceae bacterium]
MGQGSIYIKAFGEFAITTAEGKLITEDEIRSAAMTKLLLYLFLHRDRLISKDELIENLWHEEEVANPAGALKNMTYRVRNFLKQHLGDEEYILSVRGAYTWNHDIPVLMDCEEFDTCYDTIMNAELATQERVIAGELILRMYHGAFGDKIRDSIWVTNISTYYHTRFITAVSQLLELYHEQKRYEDIIAIANQGLHYDATNEALYCILIDALIATNQCQVAEEVYEGANKLFSEELGIHNSEMLTKVHERILKMCKGTKCETITDVCHDIEEEEVDGAFSCGYLVFREICRLEARKMARSGSEGYVILLSMDHDKIRCGMNLSKTEDFLLNKCMRRFDGILEDSLRVGDVVSRYNENQYIALLTSCSYESSRQVAERVISQFDQFNPYKDFKLSYSIEELSNDIHWNNKDKVESAS